jgi:hypothetical protein
MTKPANDVRFGISFDISYKDLVLIERIAKRAEPKRKVFTPNYEYAQLLKDLTVCHVTIYKFRLDEFLAAYESDFWHDIVGIYRHLNRTTWQLENGFVPRFAVTQ